MNDILHLPALLKPEQVQLTLQLLQQAPWVDGKATASDAAKLVKNNFQVDSNDRTILPQLQQLVGMAIMSEPKFNTVLYAAKVYPFLFSRYEKGMTYGWHVDSPVMAGVQPMRTDLAMTLFLSDPSTYEGGELIIRSSSGEETSFKPAAGDAIVYPCQYVHCVSEVKSGTRTAVVTWLQSSVRSIEQRQMLADLKKLHETMAARDAQSAETQQVLQTWSNLLRMWAEV